VAFARWRYHCKNSKRLSFGDFESDQPENLLSTLAVILVHDRRFRQSHLKTFRVIPFTDRPTNKQTNRRSIT